MANLDRPDLHCNKDGGVWLYYPGQKIELTDRFDAEGICYLELGDGEAIFYVTATEDGSLAISPSAYVQPSEFNTAIL